MIQMDACSIRILFICTRLDQEWCQFGITLRIHLLIREQCLKGNDMFDQAVAESCKRVRWNAIFIPLTLFRLLREEDMQPIRNCVSSRTMPHGLTAAEQRNWLDREKASKRKKRNRQERLN